LFSKDIFPELKDVPLKTALEVLKHIRVCEYLHFLRRSKSNLKTKNGCQAINTGRQSPTCYH